MAYREFIRLENAQPAGARIEFDYQHRETEQSCDFCGVILENRVPRFMINMQITRAPDQFGVQLDACVPCGNRVLAPFPAAVKRRGVMLDPIMSSIARVTEVSGP